MLCVKLEYSGSAERVIFKVKITCRHLIESLKVKYNFKNSG
jgi:hypothetical protein